VSLDEALRRIAREEDGRRFVVITFDDGYRSTASLALPVMERHNAPFTAYVPTGAPQRTLYSWWLALRLLFKSRDRVTIDAMNQRFDCPDLSSKTAGFVAVSQWIHQDLNRKWLLEPTFKSAGISFETLNELFFLNEDEIRTFAKHPLVRIGAHTQSHPSLATLDIDSARTEMTANRVYLEQLLQRSIEHFAYPYGTPIACGPREAALAVEVGFRSAVTTRHGHLFGENRSNPHFLPRIGITAHETAISLDARVSGVQRAAMMALGMNR
jgi:peptidoglycan/xylan/chitin deacetylase (PgdA/CDA1 family)